MKYLLLFLTLGLLACNPPSNPPSDAGAGMAKLSPGVPLPTKLYDPYEGLSFDPRLPNRATPNSLKAEYRSPADIEQAGCQAADGSWACKKVARKLKAPGGTANAITPPAWTVPNWYFDDANSSGVASDNNTCTSSSAPCLHYYEIVRRLGGPEFSPTNLMTVFWGMSSQPDLTDPLFLSPKGGTPGTGNNVLKYVQFLGTLPTPLCTTAITAFTAKNISGGIPPSLAVGTCLTGTDLLVVNTTRGGSTAYTNSLVSGNTYNISQPSFTCTVPGTAYNGLTCPSGTGNVFREDNTWQSGDTVSVYIPKTFYATLFKSYEAVVFFDTMTFPAYVFPPGAGELVNGGQATALEIWRSVVNQLVADTSSGGFSYVVASNTHGGLQIGGGAEGGYNDNNFRLRASGAIGNDQELNCSLGNVFIDPGSGFQGVGVFGSVFITGAFSSAGIFVDNSGLYLEYNGNFDSSQPSRVWGPGLITTLGRGYVEPVTANPDGGAIGVGDMLQLTGGATPYEIGNINNGKVCVSTFTNPSVTDCTQTISVASYVDAGFCVTNHGGFFVPGSGSWTCNQQ